MQVSNGEDSIAKEVQKERASVIPPYTGPILDTPQEPLESQPVPSATDQIKRLLYISKKPKPAAQPAIAAQPGVGAKGVS